MIHSISIFTVKEGSEVEMPNVLGAYVSFCKKYEMKNVRSGVGHNNGLQFSVLGYFEDLASWEQWDDAMQKREIDGDSFSSLMELLAKPPKIYTFDSLED